MIDPKLTMAVNVWTLKTKVLAAFLNLTSSDPWQQHSAISSHNRRQRSVDDVSVKLEQLQGWLHVTPALWINAVCRGRNI